MKITMNEQILRGNFAGNTDEEQQRAADKYAEVLERELREYCRKTYPLAELKFGLSIENASGCASGFDVWIDDAGDTDVSEIVRGIENSYDFICADMERSGEIYE